MSDFKKSTPENTGEVQDGKFKPGESGNLAGRPRGALNKTTRAVQVLLDSEAENITRKAIELAKKGDLTAIKLVMERILPPRKDVPVSIELPAMTTAADIVLVHSAILQQLGAGNITPQEGMAICAIAESMRKAVETEEIERRIATLESSHVSHRR